MRGGLFEVGRASGTGREMDGRQQSMFGGELGNTDGMQGGWRSRWTRGGGSLQEVLESGLVCTFYTVQCCTGLCSGSGAVRERVSRRSSGGGGVRCLDRHM